MAAFTKLEDSPMFRKQINTVEQTTEELKDRCQKLHKGCKKFMTAVGDAYDGDIAFADSLEAFGSGRDDPLSVSIGGPVFSKFTTAFRELGSYKELLRSQVDHMLCERLIQFMSIDLQEAKDSRRRFDKASLAYDQAREKFMSLKKGTRAEVAAELEEDLNNSKSAFERSRFNLVNALTNIEGKKKFEFLESFSAIMDAHLRYFKQGYELLSQMEPFILQVLTYAQQSKEMTKIEQDKLAKRIQEFRTQVELDNIQSASNMEASTSIDGIHVVGMGSYKSIEALMQSTADGQVETIKQGYLLKRSSNLRGDWKRRFFVLDSHGTLYYYRNKLNKATGPQSQQSAGLPEHGGGVFGRFRLSHHGSSSLSEDALGCRTVDLRTSTIKIDAEQTDLRFCFRIISPQKTYTLQAENGADRMDWVDKITGVIASLLNSPFPEKLGSGKMYMDSNTSTDAGGPNSHALDGNTCNANSEDGVKVKGHDCVTGVLKKIPGNNICAECGAPEPDWASLNLGILICIECSGVHRNLGVHISKVRSLTLDVKVWEPTILDLFGALGNSYCNTVWEELLQVQDERKDESSMISLSVTKPDPKDVISRKEKYIQSKYVEKIFVNKEMAEPGFPSHATRIWEAVRTNNIRAAYRLIVASDVNPNTSYDEANASKLHHLVEMSEMQNNFHKERKQHDPVLCPRIKDSGEPANCLQSCSLLHLACHVSDLVMLELLLQFGADINACDFHGRTPLHHCISKRNNTCAKYLLRRGARPSIRDGGGLTALERTMEMGAITDEELFILLAGNE
ncbi:ADP-ribosylation factor GTPase-activating protein AGD4-like isoform X2 [Magnolia sinica]|uniref:ADP-ribosylation factor GTPase-activating protein AGD4-like isoform X2 n=2 Tax=Magnolia sinica TaxID=86752 RepID=UPI002659F25C|nr:ADP-ribosylation factor GTPase-activating protein AGD4-like isoform X2 [Magnolia sinica]